MGTIWTEIGESGSGQIATYPLEEESTGQDYSTLAEALAAIGSRETALVIKGNQTISTAVTIPANIAVRVIAKSGSFTKYGSGTLAINGPFEAGRCQVFFGFTVDTDLIFGVTPIIRYKEWTGESGDPVWSGLPINLPTNPPQGWALGVVVLTASESWEQSNVYEPTVIYEGNPQILTGASVVFKLWYTGGWANPGIGYAESVNLFGPYTKYTGNPVLAGHSRNAIIKIGSTYYMYCSDGTDTRLDLYSSTNGLLWVLVQDHVIPLGSGGAWDNANIANTYPWIEDSTIKVLYEAKTASSPWKIGLATGPNVSSLTKDPANPIIVQTGSRGGPGLVYKDSTKYYVWCHGAPTGGLPTDIYRSDGATLTTLTEFGSPTMIRRTADEGAGTSVGQVADPFYIVINNRVYMFASAHTDGTQQSGAGRIKIYDSGTNLTGNLY